MKYCVLILSFVFTVFAVEDHVLDVVKTKNAITSRADTLVADSTIDTSSLSKKELRQLKRKIREEEKAKRNLRFSILAGPGYSPDFGVLVGGSMLFTFRFDPTDTTINRSVVPLAFAITGSGSINATSKSQLFFPGDHFRINSVLSYSYALNNYHGVGYESNKSVPRSEITSEYNERGFQINPSFGFRIGETPCFLGPVLDINYKKVLDPADSMKVDEDYLEAGGTDTGVTFFNSGIGISFMYDTRDVPANAYSGMLFESSALAYAKLLGSTKAYAVLNLKYNQYQQLHFLGARKTLAWTLQGRYAEGDVPFTDLSKVGSPFDLRGYYLGQYRDKMTFFALTEYRHMFNVKPHLRGSKFFSRFGFVAWGGLGALGDNPFSYDGVLPNYGLGLRIELQPRMNFRFDIGRDPVSENTLIYFNMTEAF